MLLDLITKIVLTIAAVNDGIFNGFYTLLNNQWLRIWPVKSRSTSWFQNIDNDGLNSQIDLVPLYQSINIWHCNDHRCTMGIFLLTWWSISWRYSGHSTCFGYRHMYKQWYHGTHLWHPETRQNSRLKRCTIFQWSRPSWKYTGKSCSKRVKVKEEDD